MKILWSNPKRIKSMILAKNTYTREKFKPTKEQMQNYIIDYRIDLGYVSLMIFLKVMALYLLISVLSMFRVPGVYIGFILGIFAGRYIYKYYFINRFLSGAKEEIN